MSPTMTPVASVVIVNYNGAHLLPRCLHGLAVQREDVEDFDAVVVDNASVDGSRELLERDFPWVRVVPSATNLGFAGGNNLALRSVTTPVVVLLNNDAVPERGWLRSLLDTFTAPGNENVAIVAGKTLFQPKFALLTLDAEPFSPGLPDTRVLGVIVGDVVVDGIDVSTKVVWAESAFPPENEGTGRFRWTRPDAKLLVPVPIELVDDFDRLRRAVTVEITIAADRDKVVSLASDGQQVDVQIGVEPTCIRVELAIETTVFDVINNAGSAVLADGSGSDIGFHEIDRGQYDHPADVFTACGNGMAMRTAIGHELGWFDDRFFMYYEDVDLSWRCRSAGWRVRYTPTARLRHVHAATSVEWSPLFVFHVERNRLLTVTKNASPGLASRSVARYVSMVLGAILRTTLTAVRQHRRPPLRQHALRARIVCSYVRLVPRLMRQRMRIRRAATVTAQDLEKWLSAEQ